MIEDPYPENYLHAKTSNSYKKQIHTNPSFQSKARLPTAQPRPAQANNPFKHRNEFLLGRLIMKDKPYPITESHATCYESNDVSAEDFKIGVCITVESYFSKKL
ncbi:hypothetical protein NC652_021161 [Populus alba x Populus x berolinensis]|nr:hypothetical protein NC652_021161 [Populus alba x Populus x berolinensis]